MAQYGPVSTSGHSVTLLAVGAGAGLTMKLMTLKLQGH